MSSSTGWPPAPTPIGTRSRSRGARGRQVTAGSTVRGSPTPSSSGRLRSTASASVGACGRGRDPQRAHPPGQRLGLHDAETRRRCPAVCARRRGPGRAARSDSGVVRDAPAARRPRSALAPERAAEVEHGDAADEAGRQLRLRPGPGRRRAPPPRAARRPAPAAPKRGRLVSVSPSIASRASRSAPTSRTCADRVVRVRAQRVRQPLHPVPLRRAASPAAQTAITRRPGTWKAASWTSMARARARAAAPRRR